MRMYQSWRDSGSNLTSLCHLAQKPLVEQICSAGRVGAERRIETKRVSGNSRSLGFDTLRYSTGVRSRPRCSLNDEVILIVAMLLASVILAFCSIDTAADVVQTVSQYPNVYLDGESGYWTFNVSEWKPFINYFRVGIRIEDFDSGEGGSCIKLLHKDNHYDKRKSIGGGGWTEFDEWATNNYITNDNRIVVEARAEPHWWDDAEFRVKEVKVEFHLAYWHSAVRVKDGSEVVEFKDIDLGIDNSINVYIENIGDGGTWYYWNIADPEWICSANGCLQPGRSGTITLRINSGNINPDNIDQLKGTLVPIYDAGLDSGKHGLKGDFYHVPNADLNDLDTALSHANRKFAYSNIFPKIEFHKSGGRTDAFSEDELFKSGSITTNVRRDFVAAFTGFIKISKSGTHRFYVTSDDGFRLKVNNTTVKEFTGGRGTATSEGTINLNKGIYPIGLTFFQGGGGKSLTLEWQPPDGSRAVVPSSVLYNGLNILVRATPKKPTVASTTPQGANGKVNVTVGQSAIFTVAAQSGSTGVDVVRYRWKKVSGSADPGTGFDEVEGSTEKNYPFSDAGEYTVYCKAVDSKGVESALLAIPVRAWNRPEVNHAPPHPDIVSWYNGKYVGVKDEPVKLMAAGSLNGNEAIVKYIWDFDNDWNTIELEQPGMEGIIGEFYQYPASEVQANIDSIGNYIRDNDVAPYLIRGFDTVDFPNTSGSFKHQSGYDTGLSNYFFARFAGFVEVPSAGSYNYQIHVGSDDGFRLRIAGQTIAEHTGTRGYAETTGTYDFAGAGLYPVELTFFEWAGSAGLALKWTPPGGSKQIISSWSPAAAYTWDNPNLDGKIHCKAVTNYGVESDEKLFDLKVYGLLQVDPNGPYNGRPTRTVKLEGMINKTSYPDASFEYQWQVKNGNTYINVETARDGKAEYAWVTDGEYEVKFMATVTTEEGLVLTGSADSHVMVEAGRPTSMPGGPYRGGIAGGNFSPVQFEGNPPDFVEAEDIGKIQNWIWAFSPGELEDNEFFTILDENVDEVIGFLVSGDGTLEKNIHPYSGQQALQVGVNQRSNQNVPGWNFKIVEEPVAPDEFRYISFAWRKDGGAGIQLQLHGSPGAWEHRYHAGTGGYTPSTQVSKLLPEQWEVHTRDLFADWGAFNLTGIAFTAVDGNTGLWDDVYLHKLPAPPVASVHGIWNPDHTYAEAGRYTVSLRVQSEYGKWSVAETTQAKVLDGKITGYVRAADLRTPVKEAQLMLTSSHVDADVLAAIAASDPLLSTTVLSSGERAVYTETDENGHYIFEHIPLGSYRVIASKFEGETVHEFETKVKPTELTLDAPNQLAIDFVDLSVFPISGRVAYSIQKNEADVLVEDVVVKAQAVGSTNTIESLPSRKSEDATGSNYNLPLFSGKYLFVANRQGHDIRINEDTPDYDSGTGLVTIDRARTDIDFIDYTTRELTVFVVDSGGYKVPGRDVIISGHNGQAEGRSDEQDGKFVATLPPGIYTVTVPGADPETEEVDVTGGDQAVTMTIPVKIVVSITPRPKLFDVDEEFLAQFGLKPEDNPEGYMYYYPPEPRTHTYTITATANGNPVEDFTLYVTDEVSMMTEDPPPEQEMIVEGEERGYTITAGKPKLKWVQVNDELRPLADTKKVTFRAEKEGYLDSDPLDDLVTVLGDVPVGTAARIISVPVMNYTVLHDPPGDGSYSYLDDCMTIKGIVSGMKIKINDEEIPVYPSPWRDERTIEEYYIYNSETQKWEYNLPSDLESSGLLGYRDSDPTLGHFTWVALLDVGTGAGIVALGPLGYALQVVKLALKAGILADADIVQYEVSPNRHLETPSGDELPDLLGPGKGDIYYGEGWTLGLQTKYRLGIKQKTDSTWELTTAQIQTYDILERTNQYIYTIRDIENIIEDLDATIPQVTDDKEKEKLEDAKSTWEGLLSKNLAYIYNRDYVSQGKSFEDFKKAEGSSLGDSETLIFSAGPTFEYSRAISAETTVSFSTEIGVESGSEMSHEFETKVGALFFGTGATVNIKVGSSASIGSGTSFGAEWESGQATEQSVGFVLNDDDIGDNISARVYADPVWGTPLFFQDAGSVTSDPWEPGTIKGIDIDELELVAGEVSSGPFDYHDGAHYKIKLQYAGERALESSGINFIVYPPTTDNPDNLTVSFNGAGSTYSAELSKETRTATIAVSLYPPEIDQGNLEEKQYEITIQAEEEEDYQVGRALTLKPKFADLRAPRAIITAPYAEQRISPVLFPETDPFDIQVVSEDTDLADIQLQIRTKQPDSVWEPWRNLSGMLWQHDATNPNVEVFDRLDRVPPRREFTFKWTENEIKSLGVGEYALRAVAKDKATNPNTDIDPPDVVFLVDDSEPTVLSTLPDYQARESQRIYRGELSAIFTDDMRADDFSDRTFAVSDLLKGGQKVAGFVSYSPALRKAIFVPIVPFDPNGFYRVEIKTDTDKAGVIERGVHDLAGNPLDNAFMWTFRTTDAPFEPTWSITLRATDGVSTDANNIAAVEYGAEDGEDERDARAVPSFSQMSLSFLDSDKVRFDRDIRPADGRLSHHWFFVIGNAANGSEVIIYYKPSIKLIRTERQYQVLRLIEFDADGNVTNAIPLDPTQAPIDPDTGEIGELEAYRYTNAGEASRYFRLDVQKANLVATEFQKGSSGWRFFSAPITPQRADPFVNLGDDIDPFQMYRYDTRNNGYKIYPLDIGEVSLQTGHGYFTRLDSNVEVDVGGSSNLQNVTLTLEAEGWHAIGNPFILPVNVADLKVNGQAFDAAVAAELIEGTLYRWKIDADPASTPDAYEAITNASQLSPWDGCWLKTKQANVTLTVPAPANIASAQIDLPDSFDPPMAPPAPLPSPVSQSQFDLRLKLVSSFSSDITTVLGTRRDAQVDWDNFDQGEPPMLDQTVAVYFNHPDWADESGLYNRDYQPVLKAGEQCVWNFTVYTDRPDTEMVLSWKESVSQVPGDVMLHFRRADGQSEWQDMREVQSVDLISRLQFTKIPFEVRAQRFEMSPPSDVQVTAGEKQVTLRWEADDNEFIDSYAITRQNGSMEDWKETPPLGKGQPPYSPFVKGDIGGFSSRYVLRQDPDNPISEFVDTDVLEEATYTYQVSVIFRSGAELRSDLFTVRTLPAIKRTALLQSYPNPFNPEVWIPYELAEESSVSIRIYSVSGQLVRVLDLGVQPRGRYISREKAAHWDGHTQTGERAASGVYFYVLRAGRRFTAAKKMVVLQ
jgi:hypothetical protein